MCRRRVHTPAREREHSENGRRSRKNGVNLTATYADERIYRYTDVLFDLTTVVPCRCTSLYTNSISTERLAATEVRDYPFLIRLALWVSSEIVLYNRDVTRRFCSRHSLTDTVFYRTPVLVPFDSTEFHSVLPTLRVIFRLLDVRLCKRSWIPIPVA